MKLKYPKEVIKKAIKIRWILVVLLGFLFVGSLATGRNIWINLILMILVAGSALEYTAKLKKAKGKFLEVDINEKKYIKRRAVIGTAAVLAAIYTTYWIASTGRSFEITGNVLADPISILILFVVLAALMFWRIYQLKKKLI
ncbi:MAG: hypothetical protein V3V78_02395 [Candidatus Woesearchaeota archaeon]